MNLFVNMLLVLLMFASTAAAPQRAAAAQSCDEFAAPFRISAEVYSGRVPVGHVTVWSCISLADAQQQAIAADAAVRQDACNRYGSCD